jgi:hypothetical protein
MMVDFGETQVFKRQMAQAVYSVVGCELASAYLLEEFANGFGVHGSIQQSALSIESSGV